METTEDENIRNALAEQKKKFEGIIDEFISNSLERACNGDKWINGTRLKQKLSEVGR